MSTADRAYFSASALLFVTSTAATIYVCSAMDAGMPMPGGWTMSMPWMKMPGQTWFAAAASFIGMWTVMMVAMMLPSLVPSLSAYRRSVREANEARLGACTALAGAGYFFVWAAVGAAAYPVGVALAAAAMRSPAIARAVPLATAIVVLLAACVQLSPWKARRLARCRDMPVRSGSLSYARRAWRHGLRLGADCALCCAGFMTVLLVEGVMNLAVMAAIGGLITLERLATRHSSAAHAVGLAVGAAGLVGMARALFP
jgi:predicted metal-binding membrane protein